MSNAAALALSRVLQHHNTTLMTLNLCCCDGNCIITIAGWSALFQFLHNPDSAMEELLLDGSFIDYLTTTANNKLLALTDVLINQNTLRELNIGGNYLLRTTGLATLSPVLLNPNLALEVLDLDLIPINNEIMISFADTLANNNRLRGLDIDNYHETFSITYNGYVAFTAICVIGHGILAGKYLAKYCDSLI